LTFYGNDTAGMKNDSGGNENFIWDRMFQLDRGVDVSPEINVGTNTAATPHDSNFDTNSSAFLWLEC
jgi:hypothetical protein